MRTFTCRWRQFAHLGLTWTATFIPRSRSAPRVTDGFAFGAYPAEYRSSGVMTFIVGNDGVVYQKDLGKKAGVLAKALKQFDPDSHWEKAEEQQEQSAEKQKTKYGRQLRRPDIGYYFTSSSA